MTATIRRPARASRWLRRLHDEVHVTSVFVTHDQDEAMEVADRVVVMNKGRIEQDGTPDEVKTNPAVIEAYLGSEGEDAAVREAVEHMQDLVDEEQGV